MTVITSYSDATPLVQPNAATCGVFIYSSHRCIFDNKDGVIKTLVDTLIFENTIPSENTLACFHKNELVHVIPHKIKSTCESPNAM